MSKKSKLKKLDKKIQKKQIEKRKEDLSKLSTKELMAKRRGVDPKSESRADYVKRRKSEMSKPSPAKFLPILGAIGKAVAAAGKVAKGIKAGATLAKGVKAVGTAQKIGKAAKVAKTVGMAAKSVIDKTGGTPPPREKMADKGMQKFASMDFAKASPNKILIKPPHPLNPKTPNATREKVKNFDSASAFKMKGFGGYGNEPSPAKLAVAKIAVKAGAKAVKAVKKAYKSYKTSKQQSPKSYGGYGRKIDMENAIKRRKIGTGSN